MTVKDIENDDEVSVYATAGRTGALVISVEAGSEAAHRGIVSGDVIVDWGGAEIRSAADLADRTFSEAPITVLRKQQRTTLA